MRLRESELFMLSDMEVRTSYIYKILFDEVLFSKKLFRKSIFEFIVFFYIFFEINFSMFLVFFSPLKPLQTSTIKLI